jgi:hypothetical protein
MGALTYRPEIAQELEAVRRHTPAAYVRALQALDALRNGLQPAATRVDDDRIAGLRKLNLPGAYRLCWLRQPDNSTIVLFVGSHEGTELFLQHNRGRADWRAAVARAKGDAAFVPQVSPTRAIQPTRCDTPQPLPQPKLDQLSVQLKRSDDLEEIIKYSWNDFEEWLVFLHPEQRRLVEADFTAPVRVRGRSGTGKTLVVLHRAFRLATEEVQKAHKSIWIFTHNEPIAIRLSNLVGRLCLGDAEVRSLIRVSTIDDWCLAFLRDFSPLAPKIDGDNLITRHVVIDRSSILSSAGLGTSEDDIRFYQEEISYLFSKFQSLEDIRIRYLNPSFKREGRQRAFRHHARLALVATFEAVELELRKNRLLHRAQLAREALMLRSNLAATPPTRAILVDEAQVATENELKLLAACA